MNWVSLSTSLCFPTACVLPGDHRLPSMCPGHLLTFHLPQRPELLFQHHPQMLADIRLTDFLMEALEQPFLGKKLHSVTSSEPSEAPVSLDTFPDQHDKWHELAWSWPASQSAGHPRLPAGMGANTWKGAGSSIPKGWGQGHFSTSSSRQPAILSHIPWEEKALPRPVSVHRGGKGKATGWVGRQTGRETVG